MTTQARGVSGAVDLNDCPNPKRCCCGMCVCGCPKHTAVHGPFYGYGRGSKPFDHEYEPKGSRNE
jgi:hypothetical protein